MAIEVNKPEVEKFSISGVFLVVYFALRTNYAS